jgi:hypothetical protein
MAGEFALVVSPRLLHELQSVLARERFRRYFTYEEATEYVSWLHHGAEVVRDPAEGVVRGAGYPAYLRSSSRYRLRRSADLP